MLMKITTRTKLPKHPPIQPLTSDELARVGGGQAPAEPGVRDHSI